MKPTRLFSEFSLISLPCILCLFGVMIKIDSHPDPKYHISLPSMLPKPAEHLPLLKTANGQLGVEVYPGVGFNAESYEFVTGETMEIGDRY